MTAPRKWTLITIIDGNLEYEISFGRPEVGVDTPYSGPWALMNDEGVIVDSGNGWEEASCAS